MKLTLLLSFFLTTFSLNIHAQTKWYVAAGSTGNGISWQQASGDLQAIINASSASNGDTIFVAAGSYAPIRRADNPDAITPLDRDNAFVLKSGVIIMGGFSNNGSHRDLVNTPSVLTGRMTTDSISFVQAYHVVVAAGVDSLAMLDGFIIKDGKADGSGNLLINGMLIDRSAGGGLYLESAHLKLKNHTIQNNLAKSGGGIYLKNSSPTISNTIIISNSSISHGGGGLYVVNRSNPNLFDITITSNTASTSNGGGILITDTSSPKLVRVRINSNTANTTVNGYGGGMFCSNYSNPHLTNVQISGNQACFGAGITNAENCLPILTNTLITGNYANWHGGGMYNRFSSIILTNVTIAGNRCVSGFGGGMLNENAPTDSILIRNSVVYYNQFGSIYNKFDGVYNPNSNNVRMWHSMVQSYPGDSTKGNIDGTNYYTDPNFWVSGYNLPLTAPTTSGDFSLKPYSILRDRGDSSLFNAGRSPNLSHIKTDIAGNKRRWGGLDIGAYEYYKTFSGNDSSICLGSNAYFSPGYPEDTFNISSQWQVDVGNGYENITEDVSKYVIGKYELKILQPPAHWQGYKYRLAYLKPGNNTYSAIFTLQFGSKWTGYEDNHWENPGNWSCDTLPNEYVDVIISGGNITISTDVHCRKLTLLNGATLTVKPGGHIHVHN